MRGWGLLQLVDLQGRRALLAGLWGPHWGGMGSSLLAGRLSCPPGHCGALAPIDSKGTL